ncbi:MAG: MBOAT family O-acyltransferase [Pseudomonadota bacterium]
MAFHSYTFVLLFLPVSYLLFLLSYRLGGWPMAFRCLGIISLGYYAQFGLEPLGVLILSVLANYVIGQLLCSGSRAAWLRGALLLTGVLSNLALLGYFKYSNFFLDTLAQVTGDQFSNLTIFLPVGISFFTFIQIGYLIEAYNRQVENQEFSRYLVFATFFPCITAGPLVLQKEIFSQMSRRTDSAFNTSTLAVGLTLFAIGLFKKCILADSIAPYSDAVFNGVSSGLIVDPVTAWAGALAYTLQLYFDFSGYSDMAIALGLIFGLKLPLNFNSPFKATNISDFWRRWHMTMTRFFTNFVYSPLAITGMRRAVGSGGSRFARYVHTAAIPAVATFLVAGVWHGAGWTFVVYGLIHGFAIAIYLGWRELKLVHLSTPVSWTLTMSVVVTALVVFRADNLTTAGQILSAMWTMGALLPVTAAAGVDIDIERAFSLIVILGSLVLLFPNSHQILNQIWVSSDPKPESAAREAGLLSWRPNLTGAVAAGLILCLALSAVGSSSGFLYYQF